MSLKENPALTPEADFLLAVVALVCAATRPEITGNRADAGTTEASFPALRRKSRRERPPKWKGRDMNGSVGKDEAQAHLVLRLFFGLEFLPLGKLIVGFGFSSKVTEHEP